MDPVLDRFFLKIVDHVTLLVTQTRRHFKSPGVLKPFEFGHTLLILLLGSNQIRIGLIILNIIDGLLDLSDSVHFPLLFILISESLPLYLLLFLGFLSLLLLFLPLVVFLQHSIAILEHVLPLYFLLGILNDLIFHLRF